MTHRNKKSAVWILLSLLLIGALLCLPIGAYAAGAPARGTLRVTLKDAQTQVVVPGARFALYPVASATVAGDDIQYTYLPDFAGCGVALADVFSEESARALSAYADAHDLEGQVASADTAGTVTFADLSEGLYLIEEVGAAPGYDPASPFLVSVPMREESGWQYDITAAPKAHPSGAPAEETALTVQKVWDSGGQAVPDQVTVALLRGSQTVDTVTLNAANDWTYTWEHLEASVVWNVREEPVPTGYTAHYSRAGNRITITNVRTGGATLIQTGETIWPILVLAGAGLALVIGGLLLLRRTKKDDHE